MTINQVEERRLLEKIHFSDDCWLWTAALSKGYGSFRTTAGMRKAHRLVWEHYVGPIPEGLVLDHLCRQRACVNPDHLEVVTHGENILRGEGLAAQQVKRTHCPRGHPYDGDNLYVSPRGARFCRTCLRLKDPEAQRRYRAKKRREHVA